MVRTPRLRDLPLFDMLMEVLSYYQCPSDCQSICCKFINIDMDRKDFKILSKASKTKIENVKKIKSPYSNSFYHSIQPPCPFLSDENKCSAYNRRPTVCRMYPFYFDFDEENNSNFINPTLNSDLENVIIKAYPCKLAINILKDYFTFSEEKLGLDHPPEMLNELVKANENFDIAIRNNDNTPLAGIRLNEFTLFNEYLRITHP